jgi:hypothetical protein
MAEQIKKLKLAPAAIEPIAPAAIEPNILEVARVKLEKIGNILKTQVANALQLSNQIARLLTIIRKPYLNPQTPTALEIDENINRPSAIANPSLTIVILPYAFTLVSKCVIFDRKYVNFDVRDDLGQTLHLTAYGSSSQVGSWRLCKMEPGNRLNKFDDYVQSTIIQWKLSRFICYWFYRHELLWDNEPIAEQDGHVAGAEARNDIRNNRAPFVFPPHVPANRNGRHLPPLPPLPFPQPGAVDAAIPVYYVMETRNYAYQTLPIHYTARTQPAENITCKIVDRGLGSRACYKTDHDNICAGNVNCPLPAPCPFDYWNEEDKGKCGDRDGEHDIKEELDGFSRILDSFYDVETTVPNGPMVITELYSDCMVYKNFKQEAHIFKVRLKKRQQNHNFRCYPDAVPLIPEPLIPFAQINFYNQDVDLVFVHYTIKQWANPAYEPRECDEPGADLPSAFTVQGYYVLTIIPTQVLNVSPAGITDCDFNDITDIGLFKNYIKAGFYACKPLDYKGQCIERTFNAGRLTAINLEYWFIGTRLNYQWPFYILFAYSDNEKIALSNYSENIIFSPSIVTGGLKRQLTLRPEQENPRLNIITNATNAFIADDLCNAETIDACPCIVPVPVGVGEKKRKAGGGNKTNKNRKRYKNKLQTYKRKKCKRRRKTMKKLKKRKTKKRR